MIENITSTVANSNLTMPEALVLCVFLIVGGVVVCKLLG